MVDVIREGIAQNDRFVNRVLLELAHELRDQRDDQVDVDLPKMTPLHRERLWEKAALRPWIRRMDHLRLWPAKILS